MYYCHVVSCTAVYCIHCPMLRCIELHCTALYCPCVGLYCLVSARRSDAHLQPTTQPDCYWSAGICHATVLLCTDMYCLELPQVREVAYLPLAEDIPIAFNSCRKVCMCCCCCCCCYVPSKVLPLAQLHVYVCSCVCVCVCVCVFVCVFVCVCVCSARYCTACTAL
jgi:hypothetical protein